MSLCFFLIILKTSKCSGSFNNNKNPFAKLCVPHVVKKINIKKINIEMFNLMSRANGTRYIEFHETCKRECRLDASVCNNKQRWNKDKCRCECVELVDKGVCDKVFICKPSNCECECDKLCDVGEYLDYESCKCRKKLVVKLIEECTENNHDVKKARITQAEHENKYWATT